MPETSRGNLFTQKLGIFLDDTYPRLSVRRRFERAGADVSGNGVGGDILFRDPGVIRASLMLSKAGRREHWNEAVFRSHRRIMPMTKNIPDAS